MYNLEKKKNFKEKKKKGIFILVKNANIRVLYNSCKALLNMGIDVEMEKDQQSWH